MARPSWHAPRAAAPGNRPAGSLSGWYPPTPAGLAEGTTPAADPLPAAGPGPAFDAPDLAAQLSRPFSTGPGEYQLTATLRPPALGTVTALVRVAPTTVHVELSAASAAGHTALHSALHDLETALQQDRRSVQVQLSPNHEQAAPGGGGDAGRRPPGEGTPPGLAAPGASSERDWETSTPATAGGAAVTADGHIDLVL